MEKPPKRLDGAVVLHYVIFDTSITAELEYQNSLSGCPKTLVKGTKSIRLWRLPSANMQGTKASTSSPPQPLGGSYG